MQNGLDAHRSADASPWPRRAPRRSGSCWGLVALALVFTAVCGCSSDSSGDPDTAMSTDTLVTPDTSSDGLDSGPVPDLVGDGTPYGQPYSGGEYHLGPVDYAETEWHNACAAGTGYLPEIQAAQGVMLAALWNGIDDVASLCDACIQVETAEGKSALLRVVSYGETTPNSIDVSPEAYAVLDSGEYPRNMSWQLTKCPDTGPLMFEFKADAHEYWTSFWVRNARVPIARVEVSGANHDFTEIGRESDGSLADYDGFGVGPFTIRVTGVDGQTLSHTFDWPTGGIGGALLTGPDNFQ